MIKNEMFIVWCPSGSTPPRVTHSSFEEAQSVAKEMARKNPLQKFIVMRAMISFTTNEPMKVEYFAQDDIPF